MDYDFLVEGQLSDVPPLLDKLSAAGLEVTVAFWLKEEDTQWYLYLATPAADDDGPGGGYARLIAAWPANFDSWIDQLQIKLIGPGSPLAQDALRLRRPRVPTRLRGGRLGDTNIQAAYIYPELTAAPAS
jgi:hypothetical protein